MGLNYKRASLDDLELLVATRIEVLRSANGLDERTDMTDVKEQSRDYFRRGFQNNSFAAYLVLDGSRLAGAGGVSFFRVMPTYHNPSGWKAYIMNMYTRPEYRRQGIAYRTLDLLVKAARGRGIGCITLEATKMGRPLYEKYGFVGMRDEMELPG